MRPINNLAPRKTLPAGNAPLRLHSAGKPANVPVEYLEQHPATREFCGLFDPDKDVLCKNIGTQHPDSRRYQLPSQEALILSSEAFNRKHGHQNNGRFLDEAGISGAYFTGVKSGKNVTADAAEGANELRPLIVARGIAMGNLSEKTWPTVPDTLEMIVPYEKLRRDSFVLGRSGPCFKNPGHDYKVIGSPAHRLSEILGTHVVRGNSGENYSKEIPITIDTLNNMMSGKLSVKRNVALKINLGAGFTGKSRLQSSVEHWHIENMLPLAGKRPPRSNYQSDHDWISPSSLQMVSTNPTSRNRESSRPTLEELKKVHYKHGNITPGLMQKIFNGHELDDGMAADRLQFAKDYGIPRRYINQIFDDSNFTIPLGDRQGILDKMDQKGFSVAKRRG
jgi:hypothetical protein